LAAEEVAVELQGCQKWQILLEELEEDLEQLFKVILKMSLQVIWATINITK
jgi:hypothetical protein